MSMFLSSRGMVARLKVRAHPPLHCPAGSAHAQALPVLPTLPWGRTNLTVLPGEAVGAAAVVLATCLLARAPIPAGPRAA